MQFLYHPDAGLPDLTVEGEAYRHLFRARRRKEGESVAVRNLGDDYLYTYRIDRITRREADLVLESKTSRVVMPERDLHLGWCVVDPKTVEKSLPALNELGVRRLSFVVCDRSQRNFVPDFARLRRILIASCQQCGRSRMMELEIFEETEAYLRAYPESALLDFGGVPMGSGLSFSSILIGCEGGFSPREREMMADRPRYAPQTPLVLRSETAAMAVAALSLAG